MADSSFEEVLEQARQLSPSEQKRLAEALSQPEQNSNGDKVESDSDIKTLGDALRKRGLLGGMTGAPPDLATNPKHMEGFGEHAD